MLFLCLSYSCFFFKTNIDDIIITDNVLRAHAESNPFNDVKYAECIKNYTAKDGIELNLVRKRQK